MTDAIVAAQIKSIELQLAVLKARFERAGDARPTVKSLGDLYGILAGTGTSNEEDIDRAQFTFETVCRGLTNCEESRSGERNAE